MTYGAKTKLRFAGSGVAALLAIYCYAGAVMNGSFAVAGAAEVEKYHRNADVFFRISVAFGLLAIGCCAWGIVRYRHERGQTEGATR